MMTVCAADAHEQDVNCVAWCPSDAQCLASCSDDGDIKLWQSHSDAPLLPPLMQASAATAPTDADMS